MTSSGLNTHFEAVSNPGIGIHDFQLKEQSIASHVEDDLGPQDILSVLKKTDIVWVLFMGNEGCAGISGDPVN